MSARSFITCPRTCQQLLSSPFDFCLNHYAERLLESGYAKSTGRRKLWAVAHFGEWILQQKIGINAIDEETVSRFLHVREQYGRPYEGDRAALTLLIALLRETGQIVCLREVCVTLYSEHYTTWQHQGKGQTGVILPATS